MLVQSRPDAFKAIIVHKHLHLCLFTLLLLCKTNVLMIILVNNEVGDDLNCKKYEPRSDYSKEQPDWGSYYLVPLKGRLKLDCWLVGSRDPAYSG